MKIGLSLLPTLLLVPAAVVFHQANPAIACAGHDHDHHGLSFQRDLQEEDDDADYCGFVDPTPQEVKEVQGKMQKWKLKKSKGGTSTTRSLSDDGPIIVPTYFHIISQTEGGLGSEALGQVGIQMEILNNRFAPYGFQFNLINQTHTVSSKWFDLNGWAHFTGSNGNAMESEMKLALRQGGRNALNVYTLDPGVLGLGTFPTVLDTDDHHLDGVMLRWSSMPFLSPKPKYELGLTLVHEVGHWLGLYHTHMGSCSCGGDLVDDTPSIASPNKGCLPPGYDSCPSLPGTDPVRNYMSYADDQCYEEFTPGQVERMRFFWEMLREPEAYGNDGVDDPAADIPDADSLPCSPIGGHYIELELKTDASSLETTWDIVYVLTGEIVEKSMGGYGENTEYHFGPYCLLPGIYTFTIYDAAGDGIKGDSAPMSQSGHYKLLLDGQKPLKNGGNFDCKESTDFIIEE